MGAVVPVVRMAVHAEPDNRLKPCETCRANGWVPELIGEIDVTAVHLPLLRNLCIACHGEGWVLR